MKNWWPHARARAFILFFFLPRKKYVRKIKKLGRKAAAMAALKKRAAHPSSSPPTPDRMRLPLSTHARPLFFFFSGKCNYRVLRWLEKENFLESARGQMCDLCRAFKDILCLGDREKRRVWIKKKWRHNRYDATVNLIKLFFFNGNQFCWLKKISCIAPLTFNLAAPPYSLTRTVNSSYSPRWLTIIIIALLRSSPPFPFFPQKSAL